MNHFLSENKSTTMSIFFPACSDMMAMGDSYKPKYPREEEENVIDSCGFSTSVSIKHL